MRSKQKKLDTLRSDLRVLKKYVLCRKYHHLASRVLVDDIEAKIAKLEIELAEKKDGNS